MATTQEYVEFVCGQIEDDRTVRYRKMFGEYMVHVNDKPLLLVCDNTVFVKQLECIRQLSAIEELDQVIPVPTKRKPKKKSG